MSEAILVAVITGGMSLLGVILTTLATSRKNEAAIRTAQAVTDAKLEALTLVFCVLALRQSISSQEFITIFTTVIAFYFGTQTAKKDES